MLFRSCLASYKDGNQEDNPYIFQPNKPVLSFVSPRSLAKSDVIVRNRDVIGESATLAALAGTVGASAARDMAAFMSLEKQLPPLDEVLKSPTTIQMPKDTAAILMVLFNAVDMLDSQDKLTQFMRFVNRIESEEIQAVFFTMMIRSSKGVRLARSNPDIATWAAKNHVLFG